MFTIRVRRLYYVTYCRKKKNRCRTDIYKCDGNVTINKCYLNDTNLQIVNAGTNGNTMNQLIIKYIYMAGKVPVTDSVTLTNTHNV